MNVIFTTINSLWDGTNMVLNEGVQYCCGSGEGQVHPEEERLKSVTPTIQQPTYSYDHATTHRIPNHPGGHAADHPAYHSNYDDRASAYARNVDGSVATETYKKPRYYHEFEDRIQKRILEKEKLSRKPPWRNDRDHNRTNPKVPWRHPHGHQCRHKHHQYIHRKHDIPSDMPSFLRHDSHFPH